MKKILFLVGLLLSALSAYADHYDNIVNRLKELDKLPNTSLFTLGQNDQGRDIIGIVVGDPSRAVTKHLVVGTHHGNERAAAIVPLHFVEALSASRIKQDTVFFVIPVLNISGYNLNRREETGPGNRTYDSNRDYEDVCLPKQDFILKSTSLISQFVDRENITAAVTVHGYVGTFTFPWGTYANDYATRDDAFMQAWAKKSVKHNGYKTGTHGAAIYPASGAFEDWAYYKWGVWSYLLEIKSPASDLKRDALTLLEFFRSAPVVRSQHVGQPVSCVDRIVQYRLGSRP